MDVVLAMDLKSGLVVHGMRGDRESYRPLTWGIAPSAEPIRYLESIRPRFLYIADLDRIGGTGGHDPVIRACASLVSLCYADRGSRSPADLMCEPAIINVIGTETAGNTLSQYRGGFLSIDVKEGKVIPSGMNPVTILKKAQEWSFDGCIILNIGAVGTEQGISRESLEEFRDAYRGKLFFGGGIAGPGDLAKLADAGFDGALVATAVHRRSIPLEWVRRGTCC